LHKLVTILFPFVCGSPLDFRFLISITIESVINIL